jgi:polar amino acid transport system permease protein
MLDGLHRIFATFFDPALIAQAMPEVLTVGLPNTLMLSAFASVIGIVLGLLVAAGLLSGHPGVRLPCRGYVDILRGLPHILTVYLIGQGLPLAGLGLFGDNTYGYAALAIGLIESAYFAEIFRAGFQSVERGQVEAARSTGMSKLQTMRYIIVPQGARRVLPPLTGQFILVVKATSLVYLLGLTASQREMFAIAQDAAINSANLSPLTAAGLVYLALTIPTTYAINAWDRRIRSGGAARPVETE